jgi:hypothetical protein
MADPTKFSQLCRFPAGLLTAIAESANEEQSPTEIDLEGIDGFRSVGPGKFDVDLDEFLALEEYSLSEENAKSASNAPNIAACLDRRMPEESYRRRIKALLGGLEGSHFVLLLLEPGLSIEGVYVLQDAGTEIEKLGGDTPDRIGADEVQQFWRYDVQDDRFVKVADRRFSSAIDAVSM